MEIQLKYVPEGPNWYATRLGVIGQNNLNNYKKPRSLPTWVDRSYVVRPYMRSTLSAKSAYQTEPPDPDVRFAERRFQKKKKAEDEATQKREEDRKAKQARRRPKSAPPKQLLGRERFQPVFTPAVRSEKGWRGGGGGTPNRSMERLAAVKEVDTRPPSYVAHRLWIEKRREPGSLASPDPMLPARREGVDREGTAVAGNPNPAHHSLQ